jgi:hypothetical protein
VGVGVGGGFGITCGTFSPSWGEEVPFLSSVPSAHGSGESGFLAHRGVGEPRAGSSGRVHPGSVVSSPSLFCKLMSFQKKLVEGHKTPPSPAQRF